MVERYNSQRSALPASPQPLAVPVPISPERSPN